MQEVAVQPKRLRDLRRACHEGLQRCPTEARDPDPRNRRNHIRSSGPAHSRNSKGFAPDAAGQTNKYISDLTK